MRVNPTLDQLGEYGIAELAERGRALREAGEPVFDFSIGDPREPTAGFIRAALAEAVPEVSQYPTVRGTAGLREAIAGYVLRRFGVTVDPETQILPTSGSKEAIFSSHFAFIHAGAGDLVVFPTPGYPIYRRGALLAGASLHPLHLGGDFVMRPAQIPEGLWRHVRMVWACSPHNPSGAVMPPREIEHLYHRCRAYDTLYCSDECYIDLFDGTPPVSLLQVAAPDFRNALVFFSLSKRSGMTGYRSGAVVGDAAAIAALRRLRTSTGTASAEYTQAAAAAAWSDDAHVADRREVFAAKRAILRVTFEKLGYGVVASRAGIYVWVFVRDDLKVSERLLEKGVLVSPGRVFGEGGEGYIRLALVPTLAECEEAAKAIYRCLTGS